MKKVSFLLVILATIIWWCSVIESQTSNSTPVYSTPVTYNPVIENPVCHTVEITPRFKQSFMDHYRYSDSMWYCFAMNISWYWYFDTFRNRNDWVSNDKKRWLSWCVYAYMIGGVTYTIEYGKEYAFANKPWKYWYNYKKVEWVITQEDLKPSPTKETDDIMEYDIVHKDCE